jgi:hypothetical protein
MLATTASTQIKMIAILTRLMVFIRGGRLLSVRVEFADSPLQGFDA